MIKDPVVLFIEDSLKRWATADICEGSEVRDMLLDLLNLVNKPKQVPEGMTKVRIIDEATPSLEMV